MSKSELLPFLDTTIVRALLMSTRAYREFLQRQVGERLYVSRFVDMEFKRGVLLTLIKFLNTLAMSHISTIEDAERAWTNRFKGREVKLILALSASIFDKYEVDRTDSRDKMRGVQALTVAIKSFDREMRRRFANLSDRTRCPRGSAPLQASLSPTRAIEDLNAYADSFEDEARNRRACRITEFYEHFRSELARCARHAQSLPGRQENEPIKKTAADTKIALEDACRASCRTCMILGDVLIAIGARRDMRLETTDTSFPHWCVPIHQPYRVHPSEVRYLHSLQENQPP